MNKGCVWLWSLVWPLCDGKFPWGEVCKQFCGLGGQG